METESAIATADDIESVCESEPLATWEHEELAQVKIANRKDHLPTATSNRTWLFVSEFLAYATCMPVSWSMLIILANCCSDVSPANNSDSATWQEQTIQDRPKKKIQATPAMSTSRISILPHVEVIFHSQHFFSIFLCISTLSMSKTVNMKQRVSRGDFSYPRRIFFYICYRLCRSKSRRSHGRHIVCFGYVHVLAEVRTSSKQQ